MNPFLTIRRILLAYIAAIIFVTIAGHWFAEYGPTLYVYAHTSGWEAR